MKAEFIKTHTVETKERRMERGWWRPVSSGLEAGSEVKEGRMSEQMGKQRPREARPFSGPTAGWGPGLGIYHSSGSLPGHPVLHRALCGPGTHPLTHGACKPEPLPPPLSPPASHLFVLELMPLGISRPCAWAGLSPSQAAAGQSNGCGLLQADSLAPRIGASNLSVHLN